MLKLFVGVFLLLFSLEALPLQKAKIYSDQNISGWMMSEKLDGIRAYWDGKKLLTRGEKEINAPEWFVQNLPPFALDGELWTKRGDFENIQSIVMDKLPQASWSKIQYMLFEVPHAKGDFGARLSQAKEFLRKHEVKHVQIIEQKVCENEEQLKRYFETILAKGGEGVMIKDGSKEYFEGRSNSLLKLKKAQDMEAKVIGYKEGKAKYSGMLGSLHVELENGVRFYIGSGFSDAQRREPPAIGKMVSFKYFGFTNKGKPKFASFIRERED